MENYEKVLAQAKAAYNSGHESMTPYIKNLLEEMFGKENLALPVYERIKTFEDARNELGIEHPLVKEWYLGENLSPDLEAYLKLRIIVAALNEGWEPQFTDGERRYYPWFHIYTKKELEEMDEERRSRVVGRAVNNASANGGLAYASAGSASSYSNTGYGSRLVFKSEELAVYCGKQFIDIWADFLLIRK